MIKTHCLHPQHKTIICYVKARGNVKVTNCLYYGRYKENRIQGKQTQRLLNRVEAAVSRCSVLERREKLTDKPASASASQERERAFLSLIRNHGHTQKPRPEEVIQKPIGRKEFPQHYIGGSFEKAIFLF